MLLFTVAADPVGMTLNREIVAEEIVRTLVGSLGLLAGVPLTNLVASLTAGRRRFAQKREVPPDAGSRRAA